MQVHCRGLKQIEQTATDMYVQQDRLHSNVFGARWLNGMLMTRTLTPHCSDLLACSRALSQAWCDQRRGVTREYVSLVTGVMWCD